jgi:WD40 repeat protein
MAPERFRGEAYPSSDLYSLGLTLYELLTLRAAFEQSDRGQLMHQITCADPPRPRKIDRHLPRDLETIVLKAIDKDLGRRYRSADELTADLRSFLEDRPIRARRTGVLERSWRWCRRNRALATLAGSVAGLLLVLAVTGSLAAFLFRNQAAELGDQTVRLRRERVLGTQRLYEVLFAQAQASRWSGRVGHRRQSLEALTEAAKLVPQLGLGEEERLKLRNEAIACMALRDLRTNQPTYRTPSNSKLLAFDIDLTHYVWSDPDGNLSIHRAADHEETARLPGSGIRAHVAQFSPNGRYLAAKYHETTPPILEIVRVWDVEQARCVLEVSEAHGFDFGPDGLLAVAELNGAIQIFDLPSGDPRGPLLSGSRPCCVRFDPNGQRLAMTTHANTEVWVVDLQAERVVSKFNHPKKVRGLSWEPDGKLLACACDDYRVYVWNTQTEREQSILVGHDAEVVEVEFNRSGDLLASFSWDNTTRLWDAWTGRQWITASGKFSRFSPDDRRLAFMGYPGTVITEVGVWEVATGGVFRPLSEPKTPLKGPVHLDISPDGRLMASAGPDGVRLWDVAGAKQIAMLVGGAELPGRDPSTVFHPSGDSLLTSGSGGLYRWPIQRVIENDRERLTIGPPDRLCYMKNTQRACVDRSGQTFCAVHGENAYVIDLQQKSEPIQITGHPRMTHIAISPDGKWVATGAWQGMGAKVWDARTGNEIKDLFADAYSATVGFSPDGKWLVAGANEVYRFWEVGTWKHSHDIAGSYPSAMAFAPSGNIMAISQTPQIVQLIDPATGKQWATLESPSPEPIGWICFNPDGSQLAYACNTHVIHSWDLRQIREELIAMGLDWDLPPYGPRQLSEVLGWDIQVDPGELRPASPTEQLQRRVEQLSKQIEARPNDAKAYYERAQALQKLGQPAGAAADFKRSLEIEPDNPSARNNLAWIYATGPPELRDVDSALALVEKAVAQRPDAWQYLNTLGVVYYRVGQWEKSIEALERSVKKNSSGPTAFDLFFMAMSYWNVGQRDKASANFSRAIAWWEAQSNLWPEDVSELQRFRAEAEQVLNRAADTEREGR